MNFPFSRVRSEKPGNRIQGGNVTKYDVAVVGAGIGGLAVAALLSRKNRNVLLVEPSRTIGGALGVLEKEGFHFSTAPMLTFGFEHDGALHDVYDALGVSPSASVLSPCYQVVLPDRRINIYEETGETLEELRREFPREIDRLTKCYRDLKRVNERKARSRMATGLSRKRSAHQFMRRYRFSRELTAFFDLQSRFFFHLPLSTISLSALTSLFASTPRSLHGGFDGFAGQMRDAILRNGGEIQAGAEWPEMVHMKGRVSGLKTRDGMVEADVLVFNTQQQQHGTTLFMAIREEGIPVGMSREVLFLPDYERPHVLLGISLSAHDDETRSPKGMRALTASFPSASYAPEMKEVLLRQVAILIPFLEQNIHFVEGHVPLQRSYDFPSGLSFKPTRAGLRSILLDKVFSRKIYLLHDGKGSPVQAVHAARRLVERLS